MTIPFSKWQGTGNDFIMVDDRAGVFATLGLELVKRLCDRHFGIGSDGLIRVQAPRAAGSRFHMEFHNPDGSQSFCGNGARCAFAFWRSQRPDTVAEGEEVSFTAFDGAHRGMALPDGEVAIAMRPPHGQERMTDTMDHWHTGSPHVVRWVDDPEIIDVVAEGRALRNSDRFRQAGVNVNFTAMVDGEIHMRTYERGVEDETLSCGTGVTAAAWSARSRGLVQGDRVWVHTRGGVLSVDMREAQGTGEVLLCGPAVEVFSGSYRV
jgi:diaminopimelate epimerase